MKKPRDIKDKVSTIQRQEAREMFMQMLFQMEVHDDYGTDIKDKFFSQKILDIEQKTYIDKLFNIINNHLDVIDSTLEGASINWAVKRIGKTDLAVLRLSVAEIMFCEDIPDAVSVNEAVELAKIYGTEESGRFVNGILGKIVKEKNACSP